MSGLALRLPDLATNTGSVVITRWLVHEGENVRRGQPIVEVETDKSVIEVESIASGVLRTIVIAAGEPANTGQPIAIIETDELILTPTPIATSPPPRASAAFVPSAAAARGDTPDRLSFFARNRLARGQQSARKLPLSIARRGLARRMSKSKQNIPHFYLQSSANAELMEVRRRADPDQKIVWDAFFVLACAQALQHHPHMAHRFLDDQVIVPTEEAINVAVDIEGDLFTLSIERPSQKSLEQISDEIQAGVARLRQGDPLLLIPRPASLTISNLGGANVESFIAIINPPESAILAVGKVGLVPAVVNGQVGIQSRVTLSLSVDHRVASGKYAARFLDAVIRELEGI
jgi:pyruvate dehydrogenase E2 component (dihydrolipoamide acetyltransferase)